MLDNNVRVALSHDNGVNAEIVRTLLSWLTIAGWSEARPAELLVAVRES